MPPCGMNWILRHYNLMALLGIGPTIGIGMFWLDTPGTFPKSLAVFAMGCVLLVVAEIGYRRNRLKSDDS